MTKKQYENTSIRGSDVEGDCLLPVVIFNFSKAYCDEAAEFLKGQDLLTGKEKGEVDFSVFRLLYFVFCMLRGMCVNLGMFGREQITRLCVTLLSF